MTAIPASYWWDRAAGSTLAIPDLEAVIFSLDAILGGSRCDDDAFRDLVWDLHCAGIRIAVITERSGMDVHRSIRDLLGDGVVEVMITGDETAGDRPDPEAYHHALWELDVRAGHAMAVEDSVDGLRAALGAGLTTVVVATDQTRGDFTGAAAVLGGYDGPEPLSVSRCRRLREQWLASDRVAVSPA